MSRPMAELAIPDAAHHPAALGTLRLVGARVAADARTAFSAEVIIEGGHIRQVLPVGGGRSSRAGTTPLRTTTTVDLSGYLLLPGLINAHDHLELNLFPRLGQGPYENFAQWARDVYHPERSPIREHVAVPKAVRLWWGGLKNLLAGVTTVCHHNPYDPEVFHGDFPVRVVSDYGWAHSLSFEQDVPGRFRSTARDSPFVIHLSEGTDARSEQEIFELDRMGALDSRTVIVHGVGLNPAGRALLEKRGAALVWCPSSNLFTLGRTLDGEEVSQHRRVALGSDSALTAEGDLLDEIRMANRTTSVGSERLWKMVTGDAADVLRLRRGEGNLRAGAVADLIALPDSGGLPADTLTNSGFREIELVVLAGQPRLLSASVLGRWPEEVWEGLDTIEVGGMERWVRAPVSWLGEETRKHLAPPVRLAGRPLSTR